MAPAITRTIASAPRISSGSGKACGSPGVMSASAPEMPPFFFGVVVGGFGTITTAVVVGPFVVSVVVLVLALAVGVGVVLGAAVRVGGGGSALEVVPGGGGVVVAGGVCSGGAACL